MYAIHIHNRILSDRNEESGRLFFYSENNISYVYLTHLQIAPISIRIKYAFLCE